MREGSIAEQPVTITVSDATSVSALLIAPPQAHTCYVLAHGAGAGMTHTFMAAIADELAARNIATLRYQFPYMENGGKRPDPPKIAHAAVRAACQEASRLMPNARLIAGGKSFGGRMTSQAQALQLLERVVGLAFIGFPLHPAKQPSTERAKHLSDVHVPMLFLQGTRDELAELPLITGVTKQLGARARLEVFDDADHSFHVRRSSGSTDEQVLGRLADAITQWSSLLNTIQ